MKINFNLENNFSKKDESQNDVITTTITMQFLLQATADVEDAKQSGVKLGLIADWMTKEQSIACLFAQYVFLNYEKKYSPVIVGNFMKKYCTDNLFLDFSSYYIRLANAQDFKIDLSIFENDMVEPVMDIAGTAKRMKFLGYREHWIPPFKELYKNQWINSC